MSNTQTVLTKEEMKMRAAKFKNISTGISIVEEVLVVAGIVLLFQHLNKIQKKLDYISTREYNYPSQS